MKTKFLVLSAAFLFAFAPLFAGNDVPKITENKVSTESYCGVTAQQIHEYMMGFGINIVSLSPITGSCDALGKADTGKNYIIHISNGIITGYEEYQG